MVGYNWDGILRRYAPQNDTNLMTLPKGGEPSLASPSGRGGTARVRPRRDGEGSPRGVLAFEGEIVRDHGDKFAIRRLSLDARDGIAEEPLQGLHVAAVPCHLDGIRASALLGSGWLGSFAGYFSL